MTNRSAIDFPTLSKQYELQDITIADCDAISCPGMSGQIHLLGLNNDASADNVTILNFRVEANERHLI